MYRRSLNNHQYCGPTFLYSRLQQVGICISEQCSSTLCDAPVDLLCWLSFLSRSWVWRIVIFHSSGFYCNATTVPCTNVPPMALNMMLVTLQASILHGHGLLGCRRLMERSPQGSAFSEWEKLQEHQSNVLPTPLQPLHSGQSTWKMRGLFRLLFSSKGSFSGSVLISGVYFGFGSTST